MKRHLLTIVFLSLGLCTTLAKNDLDQQIKALLSEKIMERAHKALILEPVTITAKTCDRSEGGIHDFYSEGDYW